jgi:hypothetical protein
MRDWPEAHRTGLLRRLRRFRDGARTVGELLERDAQAARRAQAAHAEAYRSPQPVANSGRGTAIGPSGCRVDLESDATGGKRS